MAEEKANERTIIEEKLDTLIRARYSIIWVQSHEEERVRKLLREIAISQKKVMFIWSMTGGLRETEFRPEGDIFKLIPETNDPLNALQKISELKVPKNDEGRLNGNLVVLNDFHNALFRDFNSGATDPQVNRRLRDLGNLLRASVTTIVIVSPVASIPVELEKQITVIDMPLPGIEELDKVLENMIKSSEQTAPDSVKKQIRKLREQLTNGFRDKVLEATLGLTLEEAENVFSNSLVSKKTIDVAIINAEKEQIVRKSGILEFFPTTAVIQDIGGLDNLKAWLLKRKKAFSKDARKFGLREPRGVLLTGLPGTGKSLCCKVIAGLYEMPILRLDVSKIFSSMVGSSEQNITMALKLAEATAPCVLWLDEIEKALAGVESSGQLDSGVTKRVFGQLLTWMQEHKSPVFLVATSNDPQSLKPELMRRFDDVFFVGLPNPKERDEIFKIHLRKVGRNPEKLNIDDHVLHSEGYSGAEIESVIMDSLFDAFDNGEELNDDYIHIALKKRKPLSEKRKTELDKMAEWCKDNATPASIQTEEKATGERTLDFA